MMGKLALYYNTVKYMKPSQVYYRIRKMAGWVCSLGYHGKAFDQSNAPVPVPSIQVLDFDPTFLARFPVEELMQDKVTFLHTSHLFRWDCKWEFEAESPLWNFNLHYFEYLFSLVDAYRKTGRSEYFDKTKQCICGWIKNNPMQSGGSGWAAYTIALRLTNWMSYYSDLQQEIRQDEVFCSELVSSMYQQYVFLSKHLEKDLLGNHYFEDLKTLVLCSIFFSDSEMLHRALKELKAQCREQILPDGMHFERSPMYHKIIFEDVLRVAFALRETGHADSAIESYIQPMLDVAYSLEHGLERLPLLNDGGSNVAKSLESLCAAASHHFACKPVFKTRFPDAGYYIFNQGDLRLIVDAGQVGPEYLPGHAHCDAMSFELFKDGKPVLVNCGTYAYQCPQRGFFRSTAAHNTVMVNGVEQSHCWSVFRMGERATVYVEKADKDSIWIQMRDQKGHRIYRTIQLKSNGICVEDHTRDNVLVSYLHWKGDITLCTDGTKKYLEHSYAEEYGQLESVHAVEICSANCIRYQVELHAAKDM